jgi:hypothetical protein
MATKEELARVYDDAMKSFEHAVLLGASPLPPGSNQSELLGRLLAISTAQCKLLGGIYVELVEARHDRRRQN